MRIRSNKKEKVHTISIIIVIVNSKDIVLHLVNCIGTFADKVWQPGIPSIPSDLSASYFFGKCKSWFVSLFVRKTTNPLVLNVTLG